LNPALSAFAARKSLQNQKTKRSVQPASQQNQEIKDSSLFSISVSPVEASSLNSDILALESKSVVNEARSAATETALEDIEEDQDSSYVKIAFGLNTARFLTGKQFSITC
jgi:hypothetical protein